MTVKVIQTWIEKRYPCHDDTLVRHLANSLNDNAGDLGWISDKRMYCIYFHPDDTVTVMYLLSEKELAQNWVYKGFDTHCADPDLFTKIEKLCRSELEGDKE